MVFLAQILNDYVFERINPKVFDVAFKMGTVDSWKVGAQVIPIDGKTLKSDYDREQRKSALHLAVNEYRLVLGQVKVAEIWQITNSCT